jgi:Flp pilus assembly protein TadG
MWDSIFTFPRSCHTANSPRASRPAGELGLAKALASEDGVTLIEFVPVLMIFLLLTFAIFDFGHLFYVELEVQTALQEAARYGSTGNHLPNPADPTTNLSRVQSIINTFESDAPGITVTSITVSSLNGGSTAGGPGDLLTVSATITMPVMTPLIAPFFHDGQYSYTATTTVMNEPFSSANTL